MANQAIFTSGVSRVRKASAKPDTVNKAGGSAFRMADEAALAQYACTGTFNDTFYSTAEVQFKEALALAQKVSPEFLAKTAIYAREKGFMKDMPAFLLAVLSTRDIELFKKTFPRVIDNGKMLRNFVQVMRSGAVGRKSLGSAPKKAIRNWLQARKDNQLFRDSIGEKPSLADVIKMVHPTPKDKSREALYAYLIGKKLTDEQRSALPSLVAQWESFKQNSTSAEVPDVDFRMLSSLSLTEKQWAKIAEKAPWMMTRMNLNTFERHGVFKDAKMVKLIADRLASKSEVQKAKAFPYQLLAAYVNADSTVPQAVRNALQQAMEHAVENVPVHDGKVYVMVDVSGSMSSSVTGYRKGSTSKVTCRDVAALYASCVLRKNPNAEVIVFDTEARRLPLNGFDSIMTNAQKISTPGGGTDCSVPVRLLNSEKAKGDLLIMISDNMSWMHVYDQGLQAEWDLFKVRNKDAKLVCIDILADSTSQAKSRKDTLNVGGFSDQVFEVVSAFTQGAGTPTFWTDRINEVAL